MLSNRILQGGSGVVPQSQVEYLAWNSLPIQVGGQARQIQGDLNPGLKYAFLYRLPLRRLD
jgi:hypothetical protein